MLRLLNSCLPSSLQCIDDEDTKDPLLHGNKKGEQPNQFSFEADNLCKSILKGDIHEVKAILSETTPISINERNNEGTTALCESISSNQPKIAKLLLDLGANPNGTCLNGNTALHFAVQSCNIECIALLSQFEVDCNILNQQNISPLYMAVEQNNYQLVELLLRMGASCFPHHLPLFIVNISSNDTTIFKSKKRMSIQHEVIRNPILLACALGNFPIFQLLCIQLYNEIEQKVMSMEQFQEEHVGKKLDHSPRNQEDIEEEQRDEQIELKQQRFSKRRKQDSKHSLSFSSDSSNSTVSQEAEHYFRQTIQSITEPETNTNLLLIAAQKGNLEIVDFLLNQELFDVNEHYPSHNDWTVLHFAVSSGNENLVRMLVQIYHCEINSRDEIGRTALHYASAKGFYEMISVLIELGADVSLKDDGGQYVPSAEVARSGKTAMDLAIESIHYHKVARAFRTALQERETRLMQPQQDDAQIFLEGSSVSNTNPLGKVYKPSRI